MSSNNAIISLLGWYFLPALATNYIQKIYYVIVIRAGDPKPQSGSPRYARDNKRIRIWMTLFYLAYTIFDADWQIRKAGDFYQLLGVSHDASEKAIQSRFRRMTIQFHPDKATAGADKASIEAIYVRLQLARDTLADPIKRFAYDRLGPEVLDLGSKKTIRDFVISGCWGIAGVYGSTAVGLTLVNMLGYMQGGRFWRYLVMGCLAVIELRTVTRSDFPPLLYLVLNPLLARTGIRAPYLPFQLLSLFRKFGVTILMAIAQIGPLLKDPLQPGAVSEADALSPQHLDRLDALARAADVETSRNMALELTPFASEEASMKALKHSVKEWLVQNSIRNDPGVQSAINAVLERRRAEGRGYVGLAER